MQILGRALVITAAGLASLGAASSPAPAPTPPDAVDLAPVALLVDLSSDQVLFARNADRAFLPASMTKAMTALVVFDLIKAGKLDPNGAVTVSAATAARWSGKGTSLGLRAGEQVRIRDLLMGLTTASANDAAVVLAENAPGGNTGFVAAMNARARALGMKGSRFATSNGWPDGGQTRVTASDLILLARALTVEHPELYRAYFGKATFVWRGQVLRNRDPFAGGLLRGGDGIKTGHTREAGYNFLGTAQRGGRRLVLVIGGASSEQARAVAARSLAEWGFTAWEVRRLVQRNAVLAEALVQNGAARRVPLAAPRGITVSVLRGTDSLVRTQVVYQGPLKAPVKAGAQVASLEIAVDGRPLHRVPLFAATGVSRAGPIDRIANGLLGLVE